MKILNCALSCTLLLAGCGSTVTIHQKSSDGTLSELPGIPFYTKKEVADQTTTFSQTWIKATLTADTNLRIEKNGEKSYKSVNKETFTKHLKEDNLSQLDAIKTQLIVGKSVSEATAIIASFMAIPNDDLTSLPTNQVSNVVNINWVVSEDETYYLNSPLPLFGSGSLTQKLNDNGTLAEVAAAPDTKLAESLAELIPIKEYLSGKFVAPLSSTNETTKAFLADTGLRADHALVFMSLTIEQTGYLYEFTERFNSPTDITGPLTFDLVHGKYSRTPVNSTKKKKAAEGNSIGLNGSINFPKDWGK